jgi:hypothetical protein
MLQYKNRQVYYIITAAAKALRQDGDVYDKIKQIPEYKTRDLNFALRNDIGGFCAAGRRKRRKRAEDRARGVV